MKSIRNSQHIRRIGVMHDGDTVAEGNNGISMAVTSTRNKSGFDRTARMSGKAAFSIVLSNPSVSARLEPFV